MKKLTYKHTMLACFTGYIVQAIVNNFAPLLFVTFNTAYSIPLSLITALVTVNFAVQLCVDLLSALFVDKIGYRAGMVLAHASSAAGLILLGILPRVMSNPFAGIIISVVIYAVGGGLLEVLVSPVMEGCPNDNKEKAMSLLHSFYCWGHVGVVLISTAFFRIFGIEQWWILACIWALVPLCNLFVFLKTPIAPLLPEGEKGMRPGELFKNGTFWYLMLLMVCAGASELAVSQWSSTFAEEGLHLSKAMGDLLGPTVFAVLMGLSRAVYGKYGDKLNLDRFMLGSGILCISAYLLISLVPSPVTGVLGCALTGLSVGIMWPGSFSKASRLLPLGGTAMFALLALGGDLGGCSGPTLVGLISGAAGDNLRVGILCAVVFPLLPVVFMLLRSRKNAK